MLYQINGKYGPFVLEADNELQVLAILFKLSPDNDVRCKNPILIDLNTDHIEYNIKLQEKFGIDGVNKYIDDNAQLLLQILSSYTCNYEPDHKKCMEELRSINDDVDIMESDKIFMIRMIFDAYQSGNDELEDRVHKIKMFFEQRLKEISETNTATPLQPVDDATI